MPIDSETRRDLRRLAHHLKPVVIVAERGLEESVLNEIERALSDHELIKVKLAINDRLARASTASEICSATGADKVVDIGKISVLFRPNPSAKPQLSNLQRPVSTGKPSLVGAVPAQRKTASKGKAAPKGKAAAKGRAPAKRKAPVQREPASRPGAARSSSSTSDGPRSGNARPTRATSGGARSAGARSTGARSGGSARRKPTQTR